MGTHQELMEKGGAYASLYQVWYWIWFKIPLLNSQKKIYIIEESNFIEVFYGKNKLYCW
jgi:hypothetical protein